MGQVYSQWICHPFPEQFNGMAVVLHFTLRFILFLSLFVHRMIAKHTREGKKALACLHFFRQAMDKNTHSGHFLPRFMDFEF